MSDRPILFSAPMVRALLAGTKTQTRRALKRQPEQNSAGLFVLEGPNGFSQAKATDVPSSYETVGLICIASGDRLWVREAHAILPSSAYRASVGTGTIQQREHPTDGYSAAVFRECFDRSGAPRWRPSIHMHRWASRLTLTVTDVRIQRLQDISEDDARWEGLDFAPESAVDLQRGGYRPGYGVTLPSGPRLFSNLPGAARYLYGKLWDDINGAGAWDANPWIVAISFTVSQQNIDAAVPC